MKAVSGAVQTTSTNADHTDIAVRPWLLRGPLDEVVSRRSWLSKNPNVPPEPLVPLQFAITCT
jgi:hypothetical protein